SVTVSICEEVSSGGETATSAATVVFSTGGCDSPSVEEVVMTDPEEDQQHHGGVHFLSHELRTDLSTDTEDAEESCGGLPAARRDLLEYLINEDGSVVCKWCGELLPSRTHWYRHKYKLHIASPPGPATLFKCFKCNVFFKSRKGYLGHVTTRHSDSSEQKPSACNRRARRTSEDFQASPEEYEKQREKEEKLVADIIDRVKRECEAQGSTVSRKGYSRRTTVMHT
ncbi:hypothetical protein AAG570_000881, partial [Ranatra chinensis]